MDFKKLLHRVREKYKELNSHERIFFYFLCIMFLFSLLGLFGGNFVLLFGHMISGWAFVVFKVVLFLLTGLFIYLYLKGYKRIVYVIFGLFVIFNVSNSLVTTLGNISSIELNTPAEKYFMPLIKNIVVVTGVVSLLFMLTLLGLMFFRVYNRFTKILLSISLVLIVIFATLALYGKVSQSLAYNNAYDKIRNLDSPAEYKLSVIYCENMEGGDVNKCFFDLPRVLNKPELEPEDYYARDYHFKSDVSRAWFYMGLAGFKKDPEYCKEINSDFLRKTCMADNYGDPVYCKDINNSEQKQYCEYAAK